MNIKISKAQHDYLSTFSFNEYVFGSHLFRTNNENSDKDILRLYNASEFSKVEIDYLSLINYLPNTHPFQYDDVENNTQYVWMSDRQFFINLFLGDNHVGADILLFNKKFSIDEYSKLGLLRTYKIIKGYLGYAKRDLKRFDKDVKRRNHVKRGLYTAECLINNNLPLLEGVKQEIAKNDIRSHYEDKYEKLRTRLNKMYELNEITLYPKFKCHNELAQLQADANNLKEFTYN